MGEGIEIFVKFKTICISIIWNAKILYIWNDTLYRDDENENVNQEGNYHEIGHHWLQSFIIINFVC